MLTRAKRRDESGNMMIAVAVIMILGMLSAAVVARTLSGQKSTRQGQDFSAALGGADAGLNDALFRMDQLGKAPAATFCVGNNAACSVSSIPNASDVQYAARRVDDNTYTVLSKGTVNGQPHAIQATVSRSFTYPYAIFAKTTLTFNGSFDDYNETSCSGQLQTVDEFGAASCLPKPEVATNGHIICKPDHETPTHKQNYYGNGGTNCQNGNLKSGNYDPLDPVTSCPAAPNVPPTPCVPSGVQPCPLDTTTGARRGTLRSPLPGAYLCTQNDTGDHTIYFPDGFTVGGASTDNPIEIFIISSDGSNMNVSVADATVNLNGDPTALRVYMAGAGSVLEGNGSQAQSFTGIMYAPSADATNNGCKEDWRGSIIVDQFTCNGGPHVQVWYDNRIQSIVQSSWTVTNYTEIPSNQVTLP